MKFKGILFCTDLDGTLLRNDKTVSEENKRAIDYFVSEGGLFTSVTGRMPHYSRKTYDSIRANAPFGCSNGSSIYDFKAEKYLWTRELDRGISTFAREVIGDTPGIGFTIHTFYNSYFVSDNAATDDFRGYNSLPHLKAGFDTLDEPIAKAMFHVTNEEDMQKITEAALSHPLADKFTILSSRAALLEILPKDTDKSVALLKLCELFGIDRRKTIAAGDYDNDVNIIKTAELGIAVSNACKEAKEAAKHITVSNEEHAIAKIIYDLDSGRLKI